jgi:hypothetical protein
MVWDTKNLLLTTHKMKEGRSICTKLVPHCHNPNPNHSQEGENEEGDKVGTELEPDLVLRLIWISANNAPLLILQGPLVGSSVVVGRNEPFSIDFSIHHRQGSKIDSLFSYHYQKSR